MYARKKRTNYQDLLFKSAIKSVEEKKLSVSAAARKYDIPRQTLSDKVKSKHNGTYGGRTALSTDDENVLVEYIKYMGAVGHPLNVSEIKAFAWSVGKRSSNPECFGENGPSKNWWGAFQKRHPALTLRKPDKLDRRRKQTGKRSVVKKHFDALKKALVEAGLDGKSAHIFNVDETGMSMDRSTGKVCVDRKTKKVYQESSGDREHITANVCCSASGQVLPPMIIFEKCFPSAHY